MTILLLGGTKEAKNIAEQLLANNMPVIYSQRTTVNSKTLSTLTHSGKTLVGNRLVSGGFSRFGKNSVDGLINYIYKNNIQLLLDITHPYAENMSAHADQAALKTSITYIRFQRPTWAQMDHDQWTLLKNWQDIIDNLESYTHPFFTVGLSVRHLTSLKKDRKPWLVRTAFNLESQSNQESNQELHAQTVRDDINLIYGMGPFTVQEEITLMQTHKIDVLISKFSGGENTYAKICAARQLKIPVILLERPDRNTLMNGGQEFSDVDQFTSACRLWLEQRNIHEQ